MTHREIDLLKVTQLVRAELGFKLDPPGMLFLECHGPLVVVVSTMRIYGSVLETLLFPFRIGLAKGAHFIRWSHGTWLLHAMQIVPVTQKDVGTAPISLHHGSSCAS